MRQLFIILFLIFIPFFTSAQQFTERRDSIKTPAGLQGFLHRADEISRYYMNTPELLQIDYNLLADKNFLELKLAVFNSERTEGPNSAALPENILMPLYDKYQSGKKFNLLRTVLGLGQTAAVGYLAYKHIKKYGFWD